MTLNFTKQELLRLLILAQIGDWVKHSHVEGNLKDNEELQQDKKVMQKLLSAVFKAKLNGLVEYDMKTKEYIETRALEDIFMPFIDAFNEDMFWGQLADRLAQRDMFLKYGEEELENMDDMQRITEMIHTSGSYEDTFEQDGLLDLKLTDASS